MRKHITILNNNPSTQQDKSKDLKESNSLSNLILPNNKHKKLLSPLVKEWPNSLYSYNNSYVEPSYYKSEIINKMIRNYFNLIMIDRNSKNSKRMRDLIRRSSTKKLFVSKPEIRHSTDKVIYTLYVFNKEKNLFTKKIYLLNKSLNKFNKYRMYNMKHLSNTENRLRLNTVRPINRLGTMNLVLSSNSNHQQAIDKSYLYKPVAKGLFKSWFVNKTTRGLIYYANSYNIAKRKSLLEFKTNKQIKEKLQVKEQIKLYYYKTKHDLIKKSNNSRAKWNLFLKEKTPFFNKANKHIAKKTMWRNLFKNKNNSHFSIRLLGLLSLSFNKKQIRTLRSVFFFNFVLWTLSRFNIKVVIKRNKLIIINNNQLLEFKSEETNVNPIEHYYRDGVIGSYNLPSLDEYNKKVNTTSFEKNSIGSKLLEPVKRLWKTKSLNKIKLNKINRFNKIKLNRYNKKLKILNKIKLKLFSKIKLSRLNAINNILFKLLLLVLKKGGAVNASFSGQQNKNYGGLVLEKNMNFLFTHFKHRYLLDMIKNILMKQLLGVHYLYKHSINNFKYNKFLLALKTNLLKVYNKKPEINIVNLKYLHLNSDILLEAVAIKLKNKKTKLLRTLKRALKLIKLPEPIIKDETSKNSIRWNKTSNFGSNRSSQLQDLIDVSLNKMFSKNEDASSNSVEFSAEQEKNPDNYLGYDTSNEIVKHIFTKKDKLNNLRHKWITGIKIEGKGRLTRRYRADRSLFKLKHKGSLKNINFKDIYNKKHLSLKKTQPMMLLKGQTTPNIQYSFSKWKRHIGSYGIKGWISSN